MKVCEEYHRIIYRMFLGDFNKPTGLGHDSGGSDQSNKVSELRPIGPHYDANPPACGEMDQILGLDFPWNETNLIQFATKSDR